MATIGAYPVVAGKGNCNGSNGPYTSLWIEWSVLSQSIPLNSSTLRVTMKCERNNSETYGGYNYDKVNPFYVKVDGVTVASGLNSFAINNGRVQQWGPYDYTVIHDPSGAKSCKIEGGFTLKGVSTLTGGSTMGYATLPTIPRKSSISSMTGSVALSPGQDASITVNINRASASFRHRLTFYFNGYTSGTYETGDTAYTYSIPVNEWLKLMPGPNPISGRVSMQTMNQGSPIGDPVSGNFTVTVAGHVKPSRPTLQAAPVNTGAAAGWGNVYIQGKTKCRLTAGGSAAIGGASLKNYHIEGAGYNVNSAELLTEPLSSAQTYEFTARAVDSRDRSSEPAAAAITVLEYHTPRITFTKTFRCDDVEGERDKEKDDGQYMTVCMDWDVSSCGGKNTAAAQVRFVKRGGTSVSEAIPLEKNQPKFVQNVVLDIYSSYDVIYELFDSFTSAQSPVTRTDTLSTARFVLHCQKEAKGVAVGKVSEVENAFEIGYPKALINNYEVLHKGNCSVLTEVKKNNFYGLTHADGDDHDFFRTTELGLLPYQEGQSYVGTAAVPFLRGYFKELYVNNQSVLTTGSVNFQPEMASVGISGLVAEIGQYLDFHSQNVRSKDYTARLICSNDADDQNLYIQGKGMVLTDGHIEMGTGYIKFPNGQTICWGRNTITVTTSNATGSSTSSIYYATVNPGISFPHTFATVPTVILQQEGNIIKSIGAKTTTASGVTAVNVFDTYNRTTTFTISWLAIGSK